MGTRFDGIGSSTFEHYDLPEFASPGLYGPGYVVHRRNYFLRIAILSAAALIAAAGIMLGISLILGHRHVLIGESVIVVGAISAVIVFSLGMYFTARNQDASRRQSNLATEADERTVNQRLLAQYHDITKEQAASSYRVSQVAMLVGFAMIVGGGYVVIAKAQSSYSQIVVGGLAGLGALFSSYIGATFIRTYNRALAQMNFYYAQPLVQSYVLEAERISSGLSNSAKKDTVLTQIIGQTLKGADYAAQLTRPSDEDIRQRRFLRKAESPGDPGRQAAGTNARQRAAAPDQQDRVRQQ